MPSLESSLEWALLEFNQLVDFHSGFSVILTQVLCHVTGKLQLLLPLLFRRHLRYLSSSSPPSSSRGVDPGLTHIRAYFTHDTRVAEELLHAREFIRPHAALLAAAAPLAVLADAAATAVLALAARCRPCSQMLLSPHSLQLLRRGRLRRCCCRRTACTCCDSARARRCRCRRSPCTCAALPHI